MSTVSIFCYGTLQYADIMQKVTGQQFRSQRAILYDYGRYTVKDRVYPAIIHEPGNSVEGVLYHGLDTDHIERLDRYEGREYSRIAVGVVARNGDARRALVYVFDHDKSHMLAAADWDRDVFEAEYMKRYMSRL